MKAQLFKILTVCALVAGGGALMWQYEHKWSDDAKKAEEIRKLKEQNEQLENFVSRLTTEKRVADVLVCGQRKTGSVIEETTLMFLFGRQLENWCRTEIEKLNGRSKAICLPAGKVGFRAEGAKVVVADEKAVLEWAKEHCPMAVAVVEKLLKTPVAEHFAQTGELPPGSHLDAGGERRCRLFGWRVWHDRRSVPLVPRRHRRHHR